MTIFNGQMYFSADDGVSGPELWRHDPASNVTALVADVRPGSTGAVIGGYSATGLNDRIYFMANNGLSGLQVWSYNPLSNATVRVTSLVSVVSNFTALNSQLYFTATNGVTGYELWKYNPASDVTSQVADIRSGALDSFPSVVRNDLGGGGADDGFFVFGGQLFFSADDGVSGIELWRHDPASNITTRVADIRSVSASSNPSNLRGLGSQLYFTATDGISGRELWRYDTALDVTARVADIWLGTGQSFPYYLTVLDGMLYYSAEDGITGRELWRHDPASGTTMLVKDIVGGGSGSRSFTVVDGQLYFSSGANLWRHDPANQQPIASAGGPYTAVEGQSAELSGLGSSDDSASLTYEWYLDNDEIVDATGATVAFSAVDKPPGIYTVVLKVTDDEGLSSTAEASINVITVIDYSQDTIDVVMAQITDLGSEGVLTTSQASSMQTKLDAALASLESDNTTAAANQITAMIHQIEAILQQKKTTTATAAALTSLSDDLEALLALL